MSRASSSADDFAAPAVIFAPQLANATRNRNDHLVDVVGRIGALEAQRNSAAIDPGLVHAETLLMQIGMEACGSCGIGKIDKMVDGAGTGKFVPMRRQI